MSDKIQYLGLGEALDGIWPYIIPIRVVTKGVWKDTHWAWKYPSCLIYFVAGGSAGSVNANFAHFDNFPKSSSADFGAFSASQSNTNAASKAAVNKLSLQSADKYAALANLDNIFSTGQGTNSYFFYLFSYNINPIYL